MDTFMMDTIIFLIAISGYALNGNKKSVYRISSYILWLISNTYWAVYAFNNNNQWLMFMFITYNVFCSINIIKIINEKEKTNCC